MQSFAAGVLRMVLCANTTGTSFGRKRTRGVGLVPENNNNIKIDKLKNF